MTRTVTVSLGHSHLTGKQAVDQARAIQEYWNAVSIPIGRGRWTIIDTDDYARLIDRPIMWIEIGGRSAGYANLRVVIGQWQLLHRYIAVVSSDKQIDHINGNSLDNRRQNLRVATGSQNVMNQGLTTRNRSGYKGVYWRQDDTIWCAQIRANNKVIRLGRYVSAEAAALAYNAAAILHHGEFAVLNAIPNTAAVERLPNRGRVSDRRLLTLEDKARVRKT